MASPSPMSYGATPLVKAADVERVLPQQEATPIPTRRMSATRYMVAKVAVAVCALVALASAPSVLRRVGTTSSSDLLEAPEKGGAPKAKAEVMDGDVTDDPHRDPEQAPLPTDTDSVTITKIPMYIVCDSCPETTSFSKHFFQYALSDLLPEFTMFYIQDYSSIDALLEAEPPAGGIVVYGGMYRTEPRHYQGLLIDTDCAYQHTADDPLLMSPQILKLLKYHRPMTIIDTGDWSCRMHYPPTIHNVWRTAYGRDVNKHTKFFPFWLEYGDIDDFLSRAEEVKWDSLWKRNIAWSYAGSFMYRKPVRNYLNKTLYQDGYLAEMEAEAKENGLEIVYDMVYSQVTGNDHPYVRDHMSYTYTEKTGYSYLDLLSKSRMYLTPPGDVWIGGDVWQAIEMGCLPVVERRPEYKGCKDPAGFFIDSNAPVVLIDDWADLKDAMHDMTVNVSYWEDRRQEMVRWWKDYKQSITDDMHDFFVQWSTADPQTFPENDCEIGELSQAYDEAFHHQMNMFYENEHWEDLFHDSPWLTGNKCSRRGHWASSQQCYSPKCAGPRVANFSCGGVTLQANLPTLDHEPEHVPVMGEPREQVPIDKVDNPLEDPYMQRTGEQPGLPEGDAPKPSH